MDLLIHKRTLTLQKVSYKEYGFLKEIQLELADGFVSPVYTYETHYSYDEYEFLREIRQTRSDFKAEIQNAKFFEFDLN